MVIICVILICICIQDLVALSPIFNSIKTVVTHTLTHSNTTRTTSSEEVGNKKVVTTHLTTQLVRLWWVAIIQYHIGHNSDPSEDDRSEYNVVDMSAMITWLNSVLPPVNSINSNNVNADAVQYIVVVTSVLTDLIFLKHRDELVIDTIIVWLPYITSYITASTTSLVGGNGATSYTSLPGVTGTGSGSGYKTVDIVLSILPAMTRLSCLIAGYDTRTTGTKGAVTAGGSGSDGGLSKSTAVIVRNSYFEGIDGYEDLTGLLTQTLLALISYALQLDRTSAISTTLSSTTTTSASAAVIVKDYVKVVSAILAVLKKSIHHITKHSDTFGTDFSPPAEGSVLEKCVIDQCLLSAIYDPESVSASTWEEMYTEILHSHSFSRILTIIHTLQNRFEDNIFSSTDPNPATGTSTATSACGLDKYRLSSINALIILFKHAITTISTMTSHNKDKAGSEITAFTAIVRGIVAEIKGQLSASSSSSHHHYADLKEPNSTTTTNNNTLVEEEEQSEEVYNKGNKVNNKLLRFLSKCEQSLA